MAGHLGYASPLGEMVSGEDGSRLLGMWTKHPGSEPGRDAPFQPP